MERCGVSLGISLGSLWDLSWFWIPGRAFPIWSSRWKRSGISPGSLRDLSGISLPARPFGCVFSLRFCLKPFWAFFLTFLSSLCSFWRRLAPIWGAYAVACASSLHLGSVQKADVRADMNTLEGFFGSLQARQNTFWAKYQIGRVIIWPTDQCPK